MSKATNFRAHQAYSFFSLLPTFSWIFSNEYCPYPCSLHFDAAKTNALSIFFFNFFSSYYWWNGLMKKMPTSKIVFSGLSHSTIPHTLSVEQSEHTQALWIPQSFFTIFIRFVCASSARSDQHVLMHTHIRKQAVSICTVIRKSHSKKNMCVFFA